MYLIFLSLLIFLIVSLIRHLACDMLTGFIAIGGAQVSVGADENAQQHCYENNDKSIVHDVVDAFLDIILQAL